MASPSTPQHGKKIAIYRRRPNGFNGSGLNDATWGTAATNAATALYEVEVDAEGTPDTFQWRKNGGAYTTGVSITGASQTLDEAQTITFAATTGHTIGDEWTFGNLVDEPTTESGSSAQITDTANQVLNPNSPPTWTDDGGETVSIVNFANGTGYFTGNVGNVTVDGNNAFIDRNSLEKVGYARGWTMNVTTDMADTSKAGDDWKSSIPGMASASGTIDQMFIGTDSFFDIFEDAVTGTENFYFLEFFNYDPDQDQTGDRFVAWGTITGISVGAPIGDVVTEPVNFQVYGFVSFTANT